MMQKYSYFCLTLLPLLTIVNLLTLELNVLECLIIEGFQIDLVTHLTHQEIASTRDFY